jgi:hypothetical protein
MIGFITDIENADLILEKIKTAQISRNLPAFWSCGAYIVTSGEHDGLAFIPADDVILNTPLMGDPALRPIDFPEYMEIIESLGGLNSRVSINPKVII